VQSRILIKICWLVGWLTSVGWFAGSLARNNSIKTVGLFQVALESANFATGLYCHCLQFVKVRFVDQVGIKRDIEVRLHFGAGASCDSQSVREFLRVLSLESFGDIYHDGNGNALDLVSHSEIPSE